jgi:hypothetical protein
MAKAQRYAIWEFASSPCARIDATMKVLLLAAVETPKRQWQTFEIRVYSDRLPLCVRF